MKYWNLNSCCSCWNKVWTWNFWVSACSEEQIADSGFTLLQTSSCLLPSAVPGSAQENKIKSGRVKSWQDDCLWLNKWILCQCGSFFLSRLQACLVSFFVSPHQRVAPLAWSLHTQMKLCLFSLVVKKTTLSTQCDHAHFRIINQSTKRTQP